jgi:hypothetical protein
MNDESENLSEPVQQAMENTETVQNYLNAALGFYTKKKQKPPVSVVAMAVGDVPLFAVDYYGPGCEGGFIRSMSAAFNKLNDPDLGLKFNLASRASTMREPNKQAPKYSLRVSGRGVGNPFLKSKIASLGHGS